MLTAQKLMAIEDISVREDVLALIDEVGKLTDATRKLSANAEAKLKSLEQDMHRLEAENARLRKIADSGYVERDACIGLLARMAVRLGLKTGTAEIQSPAGTERRVIVDLPSGQVSWDYLDTEAHLFESLPQYGDPVETLAVQDTYARVMNPQLDV